MQCTQHRMLLQLDAHCKCWIISCLQGKGDYKVHGGTDNHVTATTACLLNTPKNLRLKEWACHKLSHYNLQRTLIHFAWAKKRKKYQTNTKYPIQNNAAHLSNQSRDSDERNSADTAGQKICLGGERKVSGTGGCMRR